MTAQRFVLWGSAGHAKVLASVIRLRKGEVVALFDARDLASAVPGAPLFVGRAGFDEWFSNVSEPWSVEGLVAIGGHRGRDRIELQTLFEQSGLRTSVLVHPDASVCTTATLGAGTQVLAQAVVAADVRIGRAGIVNHRAGVDHECVLGDGVHVAPGATLCGCVIVGNNVMIGAGAVILPRVSIGDDAIIGAGSVITKNVPRGAVVLGNPGRARNHLSTEPT